MISGLQSEGWWSYNNLFAHSDTVDGERFAGLIIRSFSAIKFLRRYFHIALAISTHYLVELKRGTYILGKTFAVVLKTVENVEV